MKKEKMFDPENLEQKMELMTFAAGFNACTFQDDDQELVDELMSDPIWRLRHISTMVNEIGYFFTTYKKCEENQESIFEFMMFMTNQQFGVIPEDVWEEAFIEDY